MGIFLDFVWLTTRTHHGAYVRRARRNRIDRHGGEIERLALQVRFFRGAQLCQGAVPAPTKQPCQYAGGGDSPAKGHAYVTATTNIRTNTTGDEDAHRLANRIGSRLLNMSYCEARNKRGDMFSGGGFFFLISLGGQAPHVLGAHTWAFNTCAGSRAESN